MGPHGEPLGAAVGQGRLRRGGPGEVRPAGAGHVVRAARLPGPLARSPRHRGRPGRAGTRGRRLRHVVPGRLRRGVPSGVAGADGHPAQAATPLLLRPGRRGGAHPAGTHPGRIGAPVHPPSQGRGARHVPAPAAGALARQDVGRAALPGAAHADGDRRRWLQRRRGRPVAPGHGVEEIPTADGRAASAVLRGVGRERDRRRRRHCGVGEAGGVRQLRVPRVALGELRLPGVRVVVAQIPLPGRVLRGVAQRAADGLLLAAVVDAGRGASRRRCPHAGPQRVRCRRNPRGRPELGSCGGVGGP